MVSTQPNRITIFTFQNSTIEKMLTFSAYSMAMVNKDLKYQNFLNYSLRVSLVRTFKSLINSLS